jgi:transposase
MKPSDIDLENINKMFEYEKIARDIDSIDDIDILKNFAKSYIKLYLKQQEVISSLDKL